MKRPVHALPPADCQRLGVAGYRQVIDDVITPGMPCVRRTAVTSCCSASDRAGQGGDAVLVLHADAIVLQLAARFELAANILGDRLVLSRLGRQLRRRNHHRQSQAGHEERSPHCLPP